MTHDHTPTSWPSDNDLTTVAMDHVRLSYCYLDEGDVDGYCSLFAEQAVLRQPGITPVSGRRELERVERARAANRPVRYAIHEVFGSGRRIAAVGRMTADLAPDIHFVDVFTVADDGLLGDRTTFLFTPTAGHCC